uniref:Uncharacterized protein n=1 Tax=Plectus sambesii TaxID=2011161 RepID=A0A914V0Q4_9BILA
MHRMCQRLVALELRQFTGLQHRALARRKDLISHQQSAAMFASYSSPRLADAPEAGNAQNSNEKLSFSIRSSNGSRLSGEEFLSNIAKTIAKSGNVTADESGEFAIPRAAFEVLLTEYNTLLEESSAFKDKYTRALADTENVRRRGQRLTDEAKVFAIQSFCKDLLEI